MIYFDKTIKIILNNYINSKKYVINNIMNINLFKEAFAVGIIIVIVGSIVGYGMKYFFLVIYRMYVKDWNKNVMEICLFLTGFIAHLLCEYSGINVVL